MVCCAENKRAKGWKGGRVKTKSKVKKGVEGKAPEIVLKKSKPKAAAKNKSCNAL